MRCVLDACVTSKVIMPNNPNKVCVHCVDFLGLQSADELFEVLGLTNQPLH